MRGISTRAAPAVVLWCLGSVANAQWYSYEPLDVPEELGSDTSPSDINDAGVVVGDYVRADGDAQSCRVGFVRRGGVFETFMHPDAACSLSVSDIHTMIVGVNDVGDIVGIYQSKTRKNADGLPMLVGFVRRGNVLADVVYPDSYETQAIGIDERGRVVGWYKRTDDPMHWEHGFVLDETGYHTVDAPGAQRSWIYNINTRDEIVGSYIGESYVEQGFVYRRGSYTPLEYPGDTIATIPFGIASNGRIAGYAIGETCHYVCGFIYGGGAFQQLAYPDADAIETHPVGINARGVVVGAYIDASYAWRGFMAVPR